MQAPAFVASYLHPTIRVQLNEGISVVRLTALVAFFVTE
jgi:hypothetical protein